MKHTKKLIAAAMAACLTLAGCAGGGEVPVQQVSTLFQASANSSTDRFAGLVVSENAVEIKREGEKSVKELYVAQGDQVAEGDKLFCYDTDELSLTLDKQKLEMDRLDGTIEDKKKQISSVESDLEYASGDSATQLNIQLRQLQTELTQAEYDKAAKQKEVDYTQKMLDDVDVKSPISGTIRKINETGEGPYITIQQSDAYEVKGMLNELSLGAGIMEGVGVTVISRTDPTKTWNGTVSRVDYGSAQNGSSNEQTGGNVGFVGGGFGVETPMTSSTSYPFYITLDSTDGLLLGQHVHIQVSGGGEFAGNVLAIPDYYVMNLRYDEQNACNVGEVWAANKDGKLTKVEVVLAEFDPSISAYPIVSGLTESDYIADPTNADCKDGAKVSYRNESDFTGSSQATEPEGDEPVMDDMLPEESAAVDPVPEEIPVEDTAGAEAAGDAPVVETEQEG